MEEVIKGNSKLLEDLEAVCTGENAVRHSSDSFGNSYYWFNLPVPASLAEAAQILHDNHARLAIIAAYNTQGKNARLQNVCYEFVQDGVVYGITAHMDETRDSVPSISRLFPNADWHEREMMELYGIKVTNQPNPNRLFLDETLDSGLLDQMVPLSIMMNGASSTDLWERILSDKEINQ